MLKTDCRLIDYSIHLGLLWAALSLEGAFHTTQHITKCGIPIRIGAKERKERFTQKTTLLLKFILRDKRCWLQLLLLYPPHLWLAPSQLRAGKLYFTGEINSSWHLKISYCSCTFDFVQRIFFFCRAFYFNLGHQLDSSSAAPLSAPLIGHEHHTESRGRAQQLKETVTVMFMLIRLYCGWSSIVDDLQRQQAEWIA